MKVRNEYVKIKIGNKNFIKRNMLLDVYLKKLFKSQLNTTHDNSSINSCYLKFDTPIENVDYDSNLTSDLFNVTLFDSTYNSSTTQNKFNTMSVKTSNSVKITYKFDNKGFFEYDEDYLKPNDFSIFNNRKITAIGFGYGAYVFAFVDTSNMNLMVNQNEQIEITRVDKFETDGVCKGFDYPLHLVNDSAYYNFRVTSQAEYHTMAQLYSVGFGNTKGLMEEEYLISSLTTDVDDTSITFNIQRNKIMGIYPSNLLNTGFIPLNDNSKYIIFKYRLYEIDNNGNITYLYKYYTVSRQNENFGDLNIKLKIERL